MTDKQDNDAIQKKLMGLLQNIIWGPQAVPRTLESYMIMRRFSRLLEPGTPINDRLIALPKAIEILATWEPSSPDARKLSGQLVDLLQDKRRSEPIGHDSKGSGTHSYPYVRKVEGAQSTVDSPSKENFPDNKDVFGRLLSGDRTPHDNGISGMCHALATVIFLSLFRSSGGGLYYNGTSSFFDLSPLYGVSDADEMTIRINDGRGLLKPDSFFEDREVWLSQTVFVLLILLNRNHNYIARRLLAANEKGEWDQEPANTTLKQDNEIFRIARSINCIQFKNIIVEDFMKGLLGLSNVGPGVNIDFVALNQGQAYPQGDKLSVESILLYSWPALMSEIDEHHLSKFTEQELRDHMIPNPNRPIGGSENPQRIVFHDSGEKKYSEETLIRRHNHFDDGDLSRILMAATKVKAGTPGACSTPTHTKEIALTFINKARELNVCTLNEFRKSLRLEPFKTFEEWNPDGRVAQAARSLYGDINKLELYPGLQAEATMPGSGFRLGYTQTFGLLVDIVTSIRSDPRFTSDLTAKNLTSWGYKLCTSRPNNGAFGTMLSHLILRNLPRSYPYNNIYGLFPLTVPFKTQEILKKAEEVLNKDHVQITFYDFEEPKSTVTHVVTAEDEIKALLNNPKAYATPYGNDLKLLTDGYGYMLGFDNEFLHDADQDMMLYALMPDVRSYQEYTTILEETAHDLIKKRIDTKGKKQTIDIVRDVINPTCTRWVCQTICGLSFGPEGNEKDIDAWFEEFATLYTFIFRKFETVDGWAVRAEALAASKRLNKHIGGVLEKIHNPPSDMGIVNYIIRILKEFTQGHDLGRSVSRTFMERLSTTNETVGKFQRISKLEEFQNLMEHKSEAYKEKDAAGGGGKDTAAGKEKGEGKEKEKEKEKGTNDDKMGGTKGRGDGKGAVEDKGKGAKGSKGIAVTDEMEIIAKEKKRKLRNLRLIANVLGLSVVLSVNYAQACSRAIDFYLDKEEELGKIIELVPKEEPSDGGSSKTGDEQNKKSPTPDNKHLIMGYIREAQRLGQPYGLYREVKGNPDPDILERLGLKAGDLVFANFGEFHKTVESFQITPPADGADSGTVDADAVNPRRTVRSIQGLGLHKCPGIGLVDNTMPAMFETIFRLKGLRRKQGHQGKLQTFNSHIDSKDEDPKIFIDTEGRATPYPRSLVLEFDDYLGKPSKWKVEVVPTWKRAIDMFATFVSLISSLWSLVKTFWWFFSSPASLVPVTVSTGGIICNAPTTVFQRWDINTIVPGLDGQPSPIEYTLEHKKPHRLSVVDIDARDMQLAVYVDGIMRGLTTDFQLDKSNNCGEDVATCLSQNFSGGVVVVPPGRHNVKIIWAGKEYIPGTEDIDWGGEYSRRLKWQLEYCF